jgi:uncharacterized protein
MSLISRDYWENRIKTLWEQVPIVWLAGVRRVGKSSLAQGLPGVTVFDCDLPSVAEQQLVEVESFLRDAPTTHLVLDEIQRLRDPSRLLKIAADHFPHLRILATGSSTLGVSAKFSDTLTGRKRNLHLVPVLWAESTAFGVPTLTERMLRGGLPPPLLSGKPDPGFYAEWVDSYYARDVQELFRVDKRSAFLNLIEVLLRQSGGQIESSKLSRQCGASQPTVKSFLQILEETLVITPLRPYHAGGSNEVVKQPKVYAFDTGFVCHRRGWQRLEPEQEGLLWEHIVLEHLQACAAVERIHYWRDKQGHELDFVIPEGETAHIVEAKRSAGAFDLKNLAVFRRRYPVGRNFIVTPDVPSAYRLNQKGIELEYCRLQDLPWTDPLLRGRA